MKCATPRNRSRSDGIDEQLQVRRSGASLRSMGARVGGEMVSRVHGGGEAFLHEFGSDR